MTGPAGACWLPPSPQVLRTQGLGSLGNALLTKKPKTFQPEGRPVSSACLNQDLWSVGWRQLTAITSADLGENSGEHLRPDLSVSFQGADAHSTHGPLSLKAAAAAAGESSSLCSPGSDYPLSLSLHGPGVFCSPAFPTLVFP